MTDDQWWAARAPVLDEYFDPSRYPTVASIDIGGAFDPIADVENYTYDLALETFEFGLQRVLDGIEVFIRRRAEERDALSSAPAEA